MLPLPSPIFDITTDFLNIRPVVIPQLANTSQMQRMIFPNNKSDCFRFSKFDERGRLTQKGSLIEQKNQTYQRYFYEFGRLSVIHNDTYTKHLNYHDDGRIFSVHKYGRNIEPKYYRFWYDNGKLISIVEESNTNIFRFKYDKRDRCIECYLDDRWTKQFKYDDRDNIVNIRHTQDYNVDFLSYGYNHKNCIISQSSKIQKQSLRYNRRGLLRLATKVFAHRNEKRSFRYLYDDYNRLYSQEVFRNCEYYGVSADYKVRYYYIGNNPDYTLLRPELFIKN